MSTNAIHPSPRRAISPANGARVNCNSPALLWPTIQGDDVKYAIKLSQNPRFPKRATLSESGFPWAFYNPHQKLAPGIWYWRIGVSTTSQPYTWFDTAQFEIPGNVRNASTPSAADILAACPVDHPRLWVLPKESLNHPKSAAQPFVSHAEKYLNTPLKSDAFPKEKGRDAYQVFKFKRWESKALAGDMATAVQWLIPAYLLTQEDRFAREAVRRGLHVAAWDPNGFTNPDISDFADGSCMRILASVYDTFFDRLSEAEREHICSALITRAARFFNDSANALEAQVFRAHVWQNLLMQFAEAAFALLHDHPDAKIWLRYVYELWIARFPLMGGDAGGWNNGNFYFGTNVETLLVLPTLFKRLCNVDLTQHPWYRNSADFLLYTWPPQSRSDGFGDGTELNDRPTVSAFTFITHMATRFQNPYATWYIRQWGKTDNPAPEPLLSWYNLRTAPKLPHAKSPASRDQARFFPNIGMASMHTDLAHTPRDLMVGMRSSPYGAFSHSHACQNAFNIFYGGEDLFRNSGYYIAMADPHTLKWYKISRGHNTVLIDGESQLRSTEGYGMMPRFLNGSRIAYALGDASNAYNDVGLTRFRRHLVLLRPNIVLVYDDLEADHDANWQWLLHGPRKITANKRAQKLRTQTPTARSEVHLFGSQPLHIAIDDQFDPPANNWGGKFYRGKKPAVFPNQWHVTVSPTEKCPAMRYLAVFQIQDRHANTPFDVPVQTNGQIQAGKWTIHAVLDPNQKPGLTVHHQSGRIALSADQSITVGKTRYRAADATVLIEPGGVQRARDTLPAAAQ